jgi:replicative DNA helicase
MSDRVPPYSQKAEVAVLGGILLSNDAFHLVNGLISTHDFYNEVHRRIYESMAELASQLQPIDFVTLGEKLKQRGDWEKIGGTSALGSLTDAVSTSANVDYYAKIVKEKAAVRRMIYSAQEVVARGYSDHGDATEYLSTAMAEINNAATTNIVNKTEHIKSGLSAITKAALEGKQSVSRQPTGIQMLDNKSGGMPKGVLTIIGGRPGMGKSSVSLIIAMSVAQYEPVLYFTLEDSMAMVRARALSNLSGIPYFDINGGRVHHDNGKSLMLAQSILTGLNLYLDRGRLTVEEITQKTIAFKAKHRGCGLVVVDHIGYVAHSRRHNRYAPYQATADKVRNMAYLAEKIGCATICGSQLNRNVENRDPPRPRQADLRDSGEEDARQIMLLYRPSEYDEEEDPRILEINVSKNTAGPGGVVKVDFDKACCRII